MLFFYFVVLYLSTSSPASKMSLLYIYITCPFHFASSLLSLHIPIPFLLTLFKTSLPYRPPFSSSRQRTVYFSPRWIKVVYMVISFRGRVTSRLISREQLTLRFACAPPEGMDTYFVSPSLLRHLPFLYSL